MLDEKKENRMLNWGSAFCCVINSVVTELNKLYSKFYNYATLKGGAYGKR